MNTHRITTVLMRILLKLITVFIFAGKFFSSHGLQGNSSSSSMAPGFSSSSAAVSSNADSYANDRSFFIDGVEHQYRDFSNYSSPPYLAAPDFQQEWRYAIPEEIKPDCIASGASRGLPFRCRPTTARSTFAPAAADISDVTGDDVVPDRIFLQYSTWTPIKFWRPIVESILPPLTR